MSSHYQAYLRAVGQAPSQEKTRSISNPTPSPIHRKPSPVIAQISSPIPPSNAPATPSTQTRSNNITPSSTAPSSIVNASQPPPRTPLTSHPPDLPQAIQDAIPQRSPARPLPQQQEVAAPNKAPNSNGISTSMSHSQITSALAAAHGLLTAATSQHDKQPFTALLLAPDNVTILLTHFQISHVRHAESELARLAADHFSADYLAKCTLVSTWEPCAMCAGTIFWAGIGRLVFAAEANKLKDLSGDNEAQLSLPCRTVFAGASRGIEVIGPVPEWEAKVLQEAASWFRQHGGQDDSSKAPSIKSNGTGHGMGDKGSVVTTWTREDSVLSSINEDGDYVADLSVDWMK